YDSLMFFGWYSLEHIHMYVHIPKILSHFFEANKPVASVCHGSIVLTMVPEHIKGREMTAYIACKTEVEAAGATYVHEMLHEHKNLVSGHAWPDLPGLMKMFLKKL